MARNVLAARHVLALALLAALGGCGGDADAEAAPFDRAAARTRADSLRLSRAAAAAPDTARRTDSAGVPEAAILRETFAYGGGARDPFNSLVKNAKVGPELSDLQLVGIYLDLAAPSQSVAILREKDGGKRHKMRAGDRLGRIRVAQVRARDVVFMIQDFGFERQETLSLRKQEDVTP